MLKCIFIKQPWAWLIVNGFKDIENRNWITNYRGRIAIGASKYVPYEDECREIQEEFGVKLPDDFEVGGVVGTSEIVDCVPAHTSRWFFGRYGFVLRNSRPCGFIPMKGKLGIFNTLLPFDLAKNGNQHAPVNVPVVLEPKLL
jgi:ASCH domain